MGQGREGGVMSSRAALVCAAVALLAAACSSGGDKGGPIDSAGRAQVAEANGVSVEATWLDSKGAVEAGEDLSAYPTGRFVLLEIGFATHSGDVSKIDMEEAAELQWGSETLRPEKWVSISDDAHHRRGILVFQRQEVEGPVSLIINVEGQELSLTWPGEPGGS